ncbi:MAG: M48 family metalloprotease [bacterium]|nr:M48 family metalloprotease [bacterium]
MRKFTLAILIASSVLASAAYSVFPASAEPIAPRGRSVAQADFDLPGDFPGAASRTGSQTPQQRPSRAEQNGSGQAAPASGPQPASPPAYQQPPSPPPYQQSHPTSSLNDSSVPPDIGDAPAPYTSGDPTAQQQAQIISSTGPKIVEPGPVIIPSDFSRRPRVGVIKLDQKGAISHETVKIGDDGLFRSGDILADLDSMLAPGLQARLSASEAKALLELPEVVLSSRYAPVIFNCQRVLLLPPKKSSGYYGIEVDLRTLAKRRVHTTKNESESTANSDLIAQVLRHSSSDNTPVIANQNSYKYHRPDADHLPGNSAPQTYANASAARQAGLAPCPICFPETEYQTHYGSQGAVAVPDNLPLSQNQAMVERLSAVAVQIAYSNRLSPQTYRVYLLADPDYSAFAYVGGPIFISDGLLNILDSPGEVASIVAHEMAHLYLGHVKLRPQQNQNSDQSNQNQRQSGGSFLGSMASSAIGSVVSYTTGSYWAGWGARKAVDVGQHLKIKFPKHHEEEADRQALLMSFKAGYSSEDFVLTIKKIGAVYQQRSDNEWLIEHRKTEDRLNNISKLAGELGAMEVDLRAWEGDDPTLCLAWRQQVQQYLDHPQLFNDFASAYQAVKTGRSSNR